jgi:hypothetical protein
MDRPVYFCCTFFSSTLFLYCYIWLRIFKLFEIITGSHAGHEKYLYNYLHHKQNGHCHRPANSLKYHLFHFAVVNPWVTRTPR